MKVKKRILASISLILLLIAALGVFCAIPASAAISRLTDDADLLTPSEEATVLAKLDRVSAELGYDIVIVTTRDRGNKSMEAFADDWYDYNGFSSDGVLLAIDMSDRSWHISTRGAAIKKIGGSWEDIGNAIGGALGRGDYATAFSKFVDECEYYITYVPKFDAPMNFAICFVIGLVIALIVTSSMKAQLRSVSMQSGAGDYVRPGSMKLSVSRDIFLYKTVTRVEKPKESSSSSGTHTSSSGHTHGGGGGHF